MRQIFYQGFKCNVYKPLGKLAGQPRQIFQLLNDKLSLIASLPLTERLEDDSNICRSFPSHKSKRAGVYFHSAIGRNSSLSSFISYLFYIFKIFADPWANARCTNPVQINVILSRFASKRFGKQLRFFLPQQILDFHKSSCCRVG